MAQSALSALHHMQKIGQLVKLLCKLHLHTYTISFTHLNNIYDTYTFHKLKHYKLVENNKFDITKQTQITIQKLGENELTSWKVKIWNKEHVLFQLVKTQETTHINKHKQNMLVLRRKLDAFIVRASNLLSSCHGIVTPHKPKEIS